MLAWSLVVTAVLAPANALGQPPAGEPRPSAPPGAETASVRVMSFNIRYGIAADGPNHWVRRRDLLADTIRAFDPDLLGTQETLADQKCFSTPPCRGIARRAWAATTASSAGR